METDHNHNPPQMRQMPEIASAQPLDPVAMMFPGLPLFVRMAIGFVLMWIGLYEPMRRQCRRRRDMLQIFALSENLDVAALTYYAEHHTAHDWVGAYANYPKPALRQQALSGASLLMECERVMPKAAIRFEMDMSLIKKIAGFIPAKALKKWAAHLACDFSFTALYRPARRKNTGGGVPVLRPP